jgi:hypothetical protein
MSLHDLGGRFSAHASTSFEPSDGARDSSTLAVIRCETESWSWMAITFASMFALAYAASLATYSIAHALGAG